MKILYAAVYRDGSTNISQARAFERLGHEVIRFDFRADFNHDKLIDIGKSCDMALISKGAEINNKITKLLCNECVTGLWYMDPLNGFYDQKLIGKIKLCDFSLFGSMGPFEDAKQYTDNAYYVLEGYDDEVDRPVNVDKEIDVSFIGSLRPNRARYRQLVNFEVISNAYGNKHAQAVSKSKINLNFANPGGASDRVFKVLAAGGFLLSNDWPGREELFEDGKDIALFKGQEDFADKVNYYLDNEEERVRIAKHGHETNKKFDRVSWAKKIIEIYEGLKK